MILPGEKFACGVFAGLPLAFEMGGPFTFGYGCSALPGTPMPLDDWWRRQIGEIEAGQVQNASLGLLATCTSQAPAILDNENNALMQRIEFWLWGISIAAGAPGYDHALFFTGGNVNGELHIRSISRPRRVYRTAGLLFPQVSAQDICDGLTVVTTLERMQQGFQYAGEYGRLTRGVNAFVAAVRSIRSDDRLHQFVRSIEAFLPPAAWGANAFIAHARSFLLDAPDPELALRQMYQLRNVAEHLGELPRAINDPALTPEQRDQVAMRRLRQAEEFARWLYLRALTRGLGYLEKFRTNESIERFWRQSEHVRRLAWGDCFDVHTIV